MPTLSGHGWPFIGTWSSSVSYSRGDVVVRSGVLYQAVSDVKGTDPLPVGPQWVDVSAVVMALTGSIDPTAGSGIPVAIGTTYQQAGTGLYVKKNSAATGWLPPSGLSVVSVAQNGLVKDWSPEGFDPDTTTHLFIDPRAQDWQASHEYSNEGHGGPGGFVGAHVLPTTNPNGVKFKAYQNGSAVSGGTEPEWSTDGSTPVDDGTAGRPLVWTPVNVYKTWAALTAMGPCSIIESGFRFDSDGGPGSTGASKPSFVAATNNLDTVTDAGITWANNGPATVWAAATRYSFLVDSPAPASTYGQPNVIPTAAVAGTSYMFNGQPTGVYGTTDDTEPDGWEDAMPGDNSVWIDGDIMWVEDTGAATLVITGFVAPGGLRYLTVVNATATDGNEEIYLEDQAEVESDYGADSASAEANAIDHGDSNSTIGRNTQAALAYVNGHWQPVVSIT